MGKDGLSGNSDTFAASETGHAPLLTIKEAAGFLRVCPRTVHRLIKAKKLRARRVGHAVRIAPNDIHALIDAPFRTRAARRGRMDD